MAPPMTRERAESVAIQSLAFVAADDELLPRFLALTGFDPTGLRAQAAAAEPSLMGAVLDFLLGHEPTLLAFAEATGVPAGDPAKARRHFPGGEPAME